MKHLLKTVDQLAKDLSHICHRRVKHTSRKSKEQRAEERIDAYLQDSIRPRERFITRYLKK